MNRPVAVVYNSIEAKWQLFEHPGRVYQAYSLADVLPVLRKIDCCINKGQYAVGFISYEAAPAFDSSLVTRQAGEIPLLWFACFDSCRKGKLDELLKKKPYRLGSWRPLIAEGEYRDRIDAIHKYIQRGDTYQVNFTYRCRADFQGDSHGLFHDLAAAQTSQYSAYIDTDRFSVCSVSPELFFSLEEDLLRSRPMKGTVSRGLRLSEDQAKQAWLFHSEKNRAENVMIVDMIRNDMGRIADCKGIHAESLFDIEKYPTVFQMTSTVRGRTLAPLTDIMKAMFPCASVTGAPKSSTMGIIKELEKVPRGIYCGCVGWAGPGRKAQFNVAIRTLVVDKEKHLAEYGAGGGIVADSNSREEYYESKVKMRVLNPKKPNFSLLETMRWTPEEEFFLLDYHLKRLTDSAVYFDIPFSPEGFRKRLIDEADSYGKNSKRIRLLLSREGIVDIESSDFMPGSEGAYKIKLCHWPVDPGDLFLYHKTTDRAVYERARRECHDCDDTLLWNTRGEVTETTIGNLVVDFGGELFTPPVESGLLAGTFRQWLIDRGEIKERVIRVENLPAADNIFVVNSVRKWTLADLILEKYNLPKAMN